MTKFALSLALALALIPCIPAQADSAAVPASQPAATLPATRPAVVIPNALLGCWQEKDKQGSFIRSDDGRFFSFQDKQLQIGRITLCTDSKIVLAVMGPTVAMNYKLNADELTIEFQGVSQVYTRIKNIPPEVDPKPMPLGKAEIAVERLKEIKNDLTQRMAKDQ